MFTQKSSGSQNHKLKKKQPNFSFSSVLLVSFCSSLSHFTVNLSFFLSPYSSVPKCLASFSIPASLFCELRDSPVARWCHVNQIRCRGQEVGASIFVAEWHTYMNYYGRRPNADRAVTDTLTGICCGSKVTAPSVIQPRIYYSGADMTWVVQKDLMRLEAPCVDSQTLTGDSDRTPSLSSSVDIQFQLNQKHQSSPDDER